MNLDNTPYTKINPEAISHSPHEHDDSTEIITAIKYGKEKTHFQTFDQTVSLDKIRKFLHDTHQPQSKQENFEINSNLLETIIMRQHYLEQNKLFDPTEYFGGLEISDLSNHSPDRRLQDMFDEYLPTEPEEKDVSIQKKEYNHPISQKENTHSNIPHLESKQAKLTYIPKKVEKPNIQQKNSQNVGKPTNQIFNNSIPKSGIIKKSAPEQVQAKVVSSSSNKLKSLFSLNSSKDAGKLTQEIVYATQKINLDISGNEKASETERIYRKKPESIILHQSTQDFKSTIQNLLNTNQQTKNRSASRSNINKSALNEVSKGGQDKKQSTLERTISPRMAETNKSQFNKTQGIRPHTKSSGRAPEKNKDRKLDQNFASFTQGSNNEEDLEKKNSNDRSRTANPSFIEDTPILKSVLSPKFSKTPTTMLTKSTAQKKSIDLPDEKKSSITNPLKFLNDFMNKTKIGHSSSSNHLKMPKTSSFTEMKLSSAHSQKSNQSNKDDSKVEQINTIITQGINLHNYTTLSSAKRLFGTANKVPR